MARYIWKQCSVSLQICWNILRAVALKQKDERRLNGIDKKVMDWIISREISNRDALNDCGLKYP